MSNNTLVMMRWAGTVGIVGVVCFVLSTFGSYSSPAYSVTLRDLGGNSMSVNIPSNNLMSQVSDFMFYFLAPICFVGVMGGLRAWLPTSIGVQWSTQVGFLSVALWVLAGTIRLLVIPAIPLMREADLDQRLLWLQLSSGLSDGAYLLFGLQAFIISWVFRRLQYGLAGGVSLVNGSACILVMLAGPFQSLTPLSVFVYGAPAFWYFVMSAILLIEAEKLRLLTSAITTK